MRRDPNPQESLVLKYTKKPEVITRVEERLKRDERLGINIGTQEGLLLQSLCALPHVKKVVEIGTQYGCSASWMALSLGKKGHIYTLEKEIQCIENARLTFQEPEVQGSGCAIDLIEGDAREQLEKLESHGPFDLIFIDANKAAYGDYLRWARSHVALGGIIAIDNIYLFGSVFLDTCPEKTPEKMWKVMKQVIEQQLTDPDYATSIAPTEEGLMISVRRC